MALLKTMVIFIIAFVCICMLTPLGALFYLLGFLGLKKPMAFGVYKLAQAWAKMLIMMSGCNLTVRGQENIPKKGGLCFISNHGSIFDILLIAALADRPTGFIAKKELILIPILNIWIFLLGGLFIDRKNIRKALKTINLGVNRIKAGKVIVIFPEGTRSKGQGLLPFKSGALKLATQSGAPIVPIAITGSYAVFEQTNRIKAVPVSVTFAPMINTSALTPEERKKHLPDQVRRIIAAALEQDQSGEEKYPS